MQPRVIVTCAVTGNQTLPIKFRIEEGALCGDDTSCFEGSVDANGGNAQPHTTSAAQRREWRINGSFLQRTRVASGCCGAAFCPACR